MARTFKYSNPEVEFPAAIWAEFVTTVGYILNRLGKSSIDGKSPHEVWFKKTPRIKHLRIIGSKCYVHVPAQKRRKMDSEAVAGYLVGYDGDERYRIYVPEKRDIVLSRDVVFHEKIVDCDKRVSLPVKDDESVNQKKDESDPEEEIENSNKSASSKSSSESEDGKTEESEPSATRRSVRHRHPPLYLEDYATLAEAFIFEDDPKTFSKAMERDDKAEWKKAMDTEISSMHSTKRGI